MTTEFPAVDCPRDEVLANAREDLSHLGQDGVLDVAVAELVYSIAISSSEVASSIFDEVDPTGKVSSVIDAGISDAAVDDMVNNLEMFGIGASWGGFESLISEANYKRSVSSRPNGRVMRIYAGLDYFGVSPE